MKSISYRSSAFVWLCLLSGLIPACDGEPDVSTLEALPSSLQSAGGLEATFHAWSIWNEGYCGEVVLTNTHPSAPSRSLGRGPTER